MSRRAAAPTMPHMNSAFLSRRFPGRDRHLPGARHGELPRGRVLADGRGGADVGAARDAHRRHQRRVRADEAVVLDHRAVLCRAVVVAGDGARADVDGVADLGVANVREMVRLGAGAEAARLDLDEVADMDLPRQMGAGPQPRKRPDAAALADFGVVEMREGEHLGAGADADVLQHAVGPDANVVADLTRPSNTQLTSIETSRPHSSAPRTSMRAGSASVTPASSSRLASRPWQTRSSTASSCVELTPATSH